MGRVEQMEINNKKEIKESLIESFKFQTKGSRKEIAAAANDMKKQLAKKKDKITQEYITVLDEIIKEYSRKQTIEEIEKDIQDAKWAKKK